MTGFSARLREERRRLGLSQAELADAGGVSLNSQSNYENGHRSPDAAYLEAIVANGVDVAYLLTGMRTTFRYEQADERSAHTAEEATPRHVTREEAVLLDNYEHAEEEDKAAARRFLDVAAQRKGQTRRSA